MEASFLLKKLMATWERRTLTWNPTSISFAVGGVHVEGMNFKLRKPKEGPSRRLVSSAIQSPKTVAFATNPVNCNEATEILAPR